MRGDGRSQVPACREAHDTHIIMIDVPIHRMTTNHPDGLFGIRYRDIEIAVGHAVFQHDQRNTLAIEESCPLMTLVVHGEMGIATTRTTNNGTSRCFLCIGQINCQFCFVFLVTIERAPTIQSSGK